MSSGVIIRTTNYKLSVTADIDKQGLLQLSKHLSTTKRYPSFFVYRLNIYVFCIYYTGHINITGVACREEIRRALGACSRLRGVLRVKKVHIDNITCCGALGRQLTDFFKIVQTEARLKTRFPVVKFCQETFPGAQFKLPGLGTVMLFRSGKYNVVGCKSLRSAHHLATQITELVLKAE